MHRYIRFRSFGSDLWRHPGFVRLWAADTASAFGTQVSSVALPLAAALWLGASPGQMGLLAAAGTAPFLVLGLFVGVWVDRVRRRPLMIAADLLRAALLAAIPLAWALGSLRMELLYGVALLAGVCRVAFDVAWVSYLPTLVERDQFLEGNSKLQASASVAQVAGPGLGGWMVGLLSAPVAILVDALSYVASGVLLWRIRTPEPAPAAPSERRRMAEEIGEGLRAVFGHPTLRALALCSATLDLFGFVFLAVYVLYMTENLGLGPSAVGTVFAIGGAGALLGALAAGPAARRFGLGRTLVGSQVLCGLSGLAVPVAVYAPAAALPLVVFSEFAVWMMLLVFMVNQLSLRQAITPDRLLGRVTGTVRFLVSGAQPIGALLGGLLGETIGVPATLVVGSVGMLAASLWVIFSPVRGLRDRPAAPMGEGALAGAE